MCKAARSARRAPAQVHLDQWSVQATLFHGQAVGQGERIKKYLAHTARIEAK